MGCVSIVGRLCFLGPYLPSLPLVVFGFRCLERAGSLSWAFILSDMNYVCITSHHVECLTILYPRLWWADYFCFKIESCYLVTILFGFGWSWCFSGWSGVNGTLLIWFWSLVVRSLLIRDREFVLQFKFLFRLIWCSFDGPDDERWWKLTEY